jgi:trehalose 6-phosphate phosphatase
MQAPRPARDGAAVGGFPYGRRAGLGCTTGVFPLLAGSNMRLFVQGSMHATDVGSVMARLRPIWLHLSAIAERLDRSPRIAIATDFDGTLVPIAEHPDRIVVSERTRSALRALAALDNAFVCVVSGRRLEDLATHVDVEGLFLAGSAGLEIRDAQGEERVQDVPELTLPDALLDELRGWCERFPGAWAENRRHSVALHYRGVSPTLQPAFGAGVRRRVRPHVRSASIVHGKKMFEILPAAHWNKATAHERWIMPRVGDATLFYLGDDSNDEPVHAHVRSRDGISIAVGRLASRAEYGLPSPREAVWFLEWLAREWTAASARRARAPRDEAASAIPV